MTGIHIGRTGALHSAFVSVKTPSKPQASELAPRRPLVNNGLGLGPCRILQFGLNGTLCVPITELDGCFGKGKLDGVDFRRNLVRPKESWVKPGQPDALEQLLKYVGQRPSIPACFVPSLDGMTSTKQ